MIHGPAAGIPEYLLALELLIVRGCGIDYCDGTRLGEMEAYIIRYTKPAGGGRRTRMLYPDARGAKQALELLEELNAPWDMYDAIAAKFAASPKQYIEETFDDIYADIAARRYMEETK